MRLLDLIFRKKPAAPTLSMLPPQFIVFDSETTGLDPAKHEIIEIGAIRVNVGSDTHDTFSTLIVPTGRISSKITQITGITRAMALADGLSLDQALTEFRAFVGHLPTIAFNCEFDHGFLAFDLRAQRSAAFRQRIPLRVEDGKKGVAGSAVLQAFCDLHRRGHQSPSWRSASRIARLRTGYAGVHRLCAAARTDRLERGARSGRSSR